MSVVSCRALGLHFEFVESVGVDPEQHFSGLRYPVSYLRVPENRIDWETFRECMRRLAVLAGDDEDLEQVGRGFMMSGPLVLHQMVSRLMSSPTQFYLWLNRFGHRVLFPNIDAQMRVLPNGTIELVAEIAASDAPCREYFVVTKGALAATPTVFGFAPSEVALWTDGRRGVYSIAPVHSTTLWSRARLGVKRVFAMRSAVDELERNHALLQERYDTLERTKRRLDESTAQLRIVAQVGQLLTHELSLEPLALAVINSVLEQVGARHVRLLVEDEGQPVLTRSAGEPCDCTFVIELLNHGTSVGVLETEVAPDESTARRSMLDELVPWFAVAIHNALSYRRHQREQALLEEKVRARTGELQRAYDTLKAYDDARAQFFANVSHELRTPLSLMLAPTEALLSGERGALPPPARLEAEAIRDAALRLLQLTNDLLDQAAIDAGQFQVNKEPLALDALVEELVAAYGGLAERREVALAAHLERGVAVLGDQLRLSQVVLNLLTNALKYTPPGGAVAVTVARDGGAAVLRVADTGIGIAADAQARIFDRFARATSSQAVGGSGLGLSLVRHLVDLHGGTIAVESTPSVGSTFTVRLPLTTQPVVDAGVRLQGHVLDQARREVPPGAPPPVPDAVEGAPTVLVIEDHAGLRTFLERQLGARYRVLSAGDGEAGLALARRHRPDLVLSDVMLPLLSGFDVCRALKASPDTEAIPVVFLTARQQVEARVEGLDAGAYDFLVKPFSVPELLARIEVQLKLKDAMARLAHAERLSGIGMLAAGFSHEVRNPLNGLVNATEPLMALVRRGDTAAAEELVSVIRDCSARVSYLAAQLLNLARPPDQTRQEVALDETLEAALRLVGHRLPPQVKVVTSLGCPEPTPLDPNALGQVWLNLFDNALRAMPEGGVLEVRSQRTDGGLVVNVRDTGAGIAPSDQARLFRPFFTTRHAGEGTGLGLVLARQVVERHGGTVRLARSSPEGSDFEVRLPLVRRGEPS